MAYSEIDLEYSTKKAFFYECPDCNILNKWKECIKCHRQLTDEHKKVAYRFKDEKIKWWD